MLQHYIFLKSHVLVLQLKLIHIHDRKFITSHLRMCFNFIHFLIYVLTFTIILRLKICIQVSIIKQCINLKKIQCKNLPSQTKIHKLYGFW